MSAYLSSKLILHSMLVYLEFGPNFVTLFTILAYVLFKDSINPDLAALGINYTIMMITGMSTMFKSYIDIDESMLATVRLMEYKDTLPECTDGEKFDIKEGTIEFCDVSLKYRSSQENTINNVSFFIPGGCKIGLIGRSGAGKSSIFYLLLRIVTPSEGVILIDGKNYTHLDVRHMRSQITIIPQEPIVFNGSLRVNIDPFNKFTDDQLRTLLIQLRLSDLLIAVNDEFDKNLSDIGVNMPLGKRQLLALARAIVHKGKIIIMDEATASIDNELNDFVIHTIEKEFSGRTVVIIAHQLMSVVFCDEIMYMEGGSICEKGNPSELLKSDTSKLKQVISKMSNRQHFIRRLSSATPLDV